MAKSSEVAGHHYEELPPVSFGPLTMGRRKFLNLMSIGITGLIALPIAIPMLGVLFQSFIRRAPREWVSVGPVNQFAVGKTTEIRIKNPGDVAWGGYGSLVGAYMRRDSEKDFTVFSANCTHLGCPVRWRPNAELFLCPCHGGVFYKNGDVAAGPPPKSLTQFDVRVSNGNVEVKALPSVVNQNI